MGNQNAENLLKKYNKGQCSDQEKAIVETWFLRETKDIDHQLPEPDHQWVKEKIWKAVVARNSQPVQVFKLWPRITGIAAAVAFILYGVYFFNYRNEESSMVQNDIAPGKVGATLTLANGKKIALSDAANGELAKESGVVITKSADGQLSYTVIPGGQYNNATQLNTLNTANGETYRLKLPDGTVVWLNAASSIKYPASFAGLKKRSIELNGEAYLEVAKDRSHPFIVKTDQQEVEVLGTHFNLNAYANLPVTTTLAEGSVKVSTNFGEKIIAPGQQTVVKGNVISIEPADLEESLAWKDGIFRFNSESIENIMTTLSRWYDIEVVYQDKLKEDSFTGKVSRYRNISQVLQILEQTKGVHFKIEGRRVTVME